MRSAGAGPDSPTSGGHLLVRGDEVLCRVVLADTVLTRLRGLLRTDGVDGALLLRPSSSVHTVGMRYAIDVAHLDRDMTVLRVATMRRWRLGAPVRRCVAVLETEAGVMGGWQLAPGQRLRLERF